MEPNTIYNDNPPRWLVTYINNKDEDGSLEVKTIEIETEPSLWFRKVSREQPDLALLHTHFIGGGDECFPTTADVIRELRKEIRRCRFVDGAPK